MNKVSIKDLMECIELNSDQPEEFEVYNNYINIKTWEIVSVPVKFLSMIKDGKKPQGLEEWQLDNYKIAEDIVDNSQDYIIIPNEECINEYNIMEEFSHSYKDKNIRSELCNSLDGEGTFRGFKQIIYDKGIYDEWYEYRDNKFIEEIIKWCDEHDIEYVNDFNSIK